MIGVFGGTFDPVHQGHVQLACGLLHEIPLNEIRFIPCRTPVHKPDSLASASDRVAMLKLALKNEPQCVVDTREISRDTPSFMVETLLSLQAETSEKLALILGMDAFLGLPTWHQFETILTLAHFIVVGRDQHLLPSIGFAAELIAAREIKNPADFANQPAGLIYFSNLVEIPISSTEIRARFKKGIAVPKDMIDADVLEYIQKNALYLM